MSEERECQTIESSPEIEPDKRSSKRWRYGCLAIFLLLAALYYIGGRAVGTVKSWTWNRNDNTSKQDSGNAGNHISVWAGFSTSNISTTSASTTSRGEGDCVDFSCVVVRPLSEHPLGVVCAEKIAEKLKTIPAIKRIEFASNQPLIGKTEPLPPWTVRVEVADLDEWSVPNRSLTGLINVAFGTAAVQQPCLYGDSESAPLTRFEHSSTNDVRFTCTGVSSQSVFYNQIAEKIAKKTVKNIEAEIRKLSESSMILPKLPLEFYPEYREASEVPPIPGLVSKTTLIDGRRLMLPHYSLERIESNFDGTDDEFLEQIQKSMNEAGWKGRVNKSGEHTPAYMRLTRGVETFYLFKKKPAQEGLRLKIDLSDVKPQQQAAEKEALSASHVFLLERTEKMDRDSVLPGIRTLLDENASASTLLIFTNRVMSSKNEAARELRDRMRIRLLELKTGTPAEQLALVRFFDKLGEKENAKEMLLKAWQIRQLTSHPKPDADYTKLAKELDVEKEMKALPPPTAELCEEYGFIRLTPENYPMEVVMEPGKEARFVTIAEDGQLSLMQMSYRFENRTYHTTSLQTTFHEHGNSQGNMTSSGTGPSFMQGLPLDQQGSFHFSVVPDKASNSNGVIRLKVEFNKSIHL